MRPLHYFDFPSSVWDGLSNHNTRRDRNDIISPDGRDWIKVTDELISVQENLLGVADNPIDSLAGEFGLDGNENFYLPKRINLSFENVSLDTVDAGAAGAHASLKLLTLETNKIQLISRSFLADAETISAETGGGVGISDTATVELGVGTSQVGVADSTLTGTEDDILESFNINLIAGTNQANVDSESGSVEIITVPGSTMDLWLNIAIPGADHGGTDDALIINGTLTINLFRM